jgi:glycolate oxidase FAD binding subunit
MADDPILRALMAACPQARPASSADAVAGGTPRYAASPATVAEASAVLRAAAEHDLAVVPRGSGSKLGWGASPRRCDLVVDTLRLDRVLEHAAGDLVARVQAGVGLERLAEVLGGAGQELALDPAPGLGSPDGVPPDWAGGRSVDGAGVDGANVDGAGLDGAGLDGAGLDGPGGGSGAYPGGGTVGGTLATAAAGPRRLRYGTPRDLVIGVTVIRADGTVAHSGGKVVKNVAGYDLGKLFTGSFGTLGLIVEAVFRLHPRPAATAYVTLDCAGAAAAHRAVAAASASVLAPSAIEIDRPARGRPITAGVLLEGEPAGVGERAALMRELLGGAAQIQPSRPAWWGGPDGDTAHPAGTLIRVAFWAAALSSVLAVIDSAAQSAGLDPAVGGSAAAGVIYAAVGPDVAPAAAGAFVSALRAALARGEGDARPAAAGPSEAPPVMASAVVVHAPAAVRDLVDLWGPVPSLPLMRAVKDQFDPGHRMAPGRFAGGI